MNKGIQLRIGKTPELYFLFRFLLLQCFAEYIEIGPVMRRAVDGKPDLPEMPVEFR